MNKTVRIKYDDETLQRHITVDGEPLDTTMIACKKLTAWISPFKKDGGKWDGLFQELAKAVGSEEYEIMFSGSDASMKLLGKKCPKTVTVTKEQKPSEDAAAPKGFLKDFKELPQEPLQKSEEPEEINYNKVTQEMIELYFYFIGGEYRKKEKVTVMTYYNRTKELADMGYTFPQFLLSDILFAGEIVEKNEEEALRLLKISAEAGCSDSEYKYGVYLVKGRYAEKNPSLGWEYVKRAADQRIVGAMIDRGVEYFREKDYEKATFYFEKASRCDDEIAKRYLGIMHYQGIYYEENKFTAMKYFIDSAELEYAPSVCDIGDEYLYGYFYKENIPLAIKYYECALEFDKKCSHAMFKLGLCRYLGIFVPKDEEYGFYLIEQAADLGHDKAVKFFAEADEINAQLALSKINFGKAKNMRDIALKIPILAEYLAPLKTGWNFADDPEHHFLCYDE